MTSDRALSGIRILDLTLGLSKDDVAALRERNVVGG
jgi:hypothetical protein